MPKSNQATCETPIIILGKTPTQNHTFLQNLLIEEIFCVDRWGEHKKASSTSQNVEIVSQCLNCSTQLVFNRLGDQLHGTIFHFFIAFMAVAFIAFFMAGWAAGAACAAAFFIAFFMAAIVQKDER